MTSQPSNEERNLLRLRAWEQRTQETSRAKELNPENVPLFGEPYKTHKGDELSTRVQRMLGSFEDVSGAVETVSISTCAAYSQSDQGPPNLDKSTKPAFHSHVHHTSTQSPKAPPSNGHFAQSTRKSTVSASPNHQGPSSTYPTAFLNHNQGCQLSHSVHQQIKTEAFPDLGECVGLAHDTKSPDAQPLTPLHSNDHSYTEPKDMDTKDTLERRWHQVSSDHPSEYANTMDVPSLDLKQSPKDASLPQANKGNNALPSQTFPPLLSSKAPNTVMTQKPTAYVRPMDGQDQVVKESPDLKPSPEPYEPLPELITSKPNLSKMKTLPQFLETNEAQGVEDILREMSHPWPPLLTAIHTPNTGETSKSPLLAKMSELLGYTPNNTAPTCSNVVTPPPTKCSLFAPVAISKETEKCPGQKNPKSSPTDVSNNKHSAEVAHSSGVESANSSDSESSSRSDSDSENGMEEPAQPLERNSAKTKPDVPAVTHADWQLGNWIRSSQQNSEVQGGSQASESPAHKRLPATLSAKCSSVEALNPTSEPMCSHQKQLGANLSKPQPCNESLQNNHSQQITHKSPDTRCRRLSGNDPSKPAKPSCPEDSQVAVKVKPVEVVATQDKDQGFTHRPKVKTKTGHCMTSKDRRDCKTDAKKNKHGLREKQKAKSEPGHETTHTLHGHCPSCGVRSFGPCSCPTPNSAQLDQLSPAAPVAVSSRKHKTEPAHRKGTKKPHNGLCPAARHPEKLGKTPKVSRDPKKPPVTLLVKIDLSLLSRIPLTTNRPPNSVKRPAVAPEQDKGSSGALSTFDLTKTSKKGLPPNVDGEHKSLPRKKQKLEKTSKNTPLSHASAKPESSSAAAEEHKGKKAKKNVHPGSKDAAHGSKVHKRGPGESQKSSKDTLKCRDATVKRKKSHGKPTEHPNLEKKPPKSASLSTQPTREASTNRPLLRLEDRQYPVKHYIKEAKRLKHKADAESDKFGKAFNYLEAAMYFVESGITMEKDPQISVSSYTMFSETVELLKFVLKLKNPVDPSASPSEQDFVSLCLKCQSLLQMAMFRSKRKTALKYSKTLNDHFNVGVKNSSQAAQDPSKSADTPSHASYMPSPAATSGTVSGTVTVPQAIEQVAFSYVSITSLFLNAHELWEQGVELAHKGNGMATELDTLLGPLSLASDLSSMVHYMRQGVHWLRVDARRAK
ncbi:AF4/FMR2 family member 1 isoform X2 [Genypterus blacodes]|uniref:AF4/FMR2 family member 1 isoform X2 n=1 Tax=Genypterus blacodes TaxID=154954 RepID=UPI003F76AA2E